MSTMSHAGHETCWQKTLQQFLGMRVRLTLRSGGMLEGELRDPQAFTVKLEQLAGAERLVDYSQILSVEASQ